MKNKGFTLLELLVVIGIIAVLVSLATVAYSGAQRKSRDSRRQSDMRSVQGALEVYYSENTYVYPITCSDAGDYVKGVWPVDPVNADDLVYVESCTAASYCVCAKLEVEGKGNASASDCSWGVGDYYCVGNLQ